MSTAPVADQQRLLDVQAIDTRLAQLAHQRRSHPSLATLAEFSTRAQDLERVRAETAVVVSDTRRELVKAETDVEQVANRAARDQQRLDSGSGSAKDLQAMAHELESLHRRKEALEEIELEVMERLEAAEGEINAITDQAEALRADAQRIEGERDAAFAQLDEAIAAAQADRAAAVEGLDANLLALYERVRSQTGGLAAVAIRGESTEGVQLTLSLTERAAIRDAAPEEVIRSEDYGYILVRVS
ncbi:hypothetical protein EXU48_19180 [Occultella glacieicola]|uniref:CT398-like coiled coil hairpin domain-containing protein n=1 Tax=Occultella glacieicola TaxID=2518684 RepID=A0ABY2E2R5_9MICO|nr:hypothetical protein [Occultella glacieicola]TDE90046.1 hypothetical protein EXU48_19180 [Occultella glacieicola]